MVSVGGSLLSVLLLMGATCGSGAAADQVGRVPGSGLRMASGSFVET